MLMIAIVPAIVVAAVAVVTGSRFWTWMAAAAAAAVGVFSGQPQFMAVDLVTVALALWMSLAGLRGKSKPSVEKPAPAKEQSSADHGVAALVGLISVAALAFLFLTPSTQTPDTTKVQPAPAANAVKQMPTVPSAKTQMPVDPQSQKQRQKVDSKVTQNPRVANSVTAQRVNPLTPLEQCLTIPSEAGMSRCIERLKQ